MLNSSPTNKGIVHFLRTNPVTAFAAITIVVLMALLLLSLIG